MRLKNCSKKEKFNISNNKGIKQVGCLGNRILFLTNDNTLYMKGILYDKTNTPNSKNVRNSPKIYFTSPLG